MTENNREEYTTEQIDLNNLGSNNTVQVGMNKPRKKGFTGNKFLHYVGRSVKLTLKYFGAKLLISIILGVLAGIIFSVIKIDGEGIAGPGWCGLLAGVGNCIPIFGQWISCGVIVIMTLIFGNWKLALLAFVVLMGLQVLDEFLLTPLIVGKSLSFKPIFIMAIMIVASMVCGPWGIIFAVPLAAIVKLGFELFYLRKDFAEIDEEAEDQ